jgi:CD2 antigen cytoplasmic tail-binding protein 2
MSSSNGTASSQAGQRRTVRFAPRGELSSPPPPVTSSSGRRRTRTGYTDQQNSNLSANTGGIHDRRKTTTLRPQKRPRVDLPNEDDDDDDDDIRDDAEDDWKPDTDDDDDEGTVVTSERQLLEAKRQRRLQRQLQLTDKDLAEYDTNDDDAAIDMDDTDDDPPHSTKTNNNSATSLAAEGVEIEPFNMQQEQNDGMGYFDGDTYIFRSRDPDEEPDAWLESLDEENVDGSSSSKRGHNALAVTAASRANLQKSSSRLEESKKQQQQEDMVQWTEHELYAVILPLVSETETVMQAIVRYGKLMKRKSNVNNNNKQKDSTKHAAGGLVLSLSAEATSMAQISLHQLTEASNILLTKGMVDIYQTTHAELLNRLPPVPDNDQEDDDRSEHHKETIDNNKELLLLSHPPPPPAVQWEYQGSQDGRIHGPYSTKEMLDWTGAGYFVGASAVMVRTLLIERKPETTNSCQTKQKSLQDDRLDDLNDNDDEDKKETESATETAIRGEWQLSDRVDFSRFLVSWLKNMPQPGVR